MGVDVANVGSSALGPLGVVLILIIGLAWLTVAATVALKGDSVEQPNRVAQLYGYTVCLISLVVALITTNSLINAAIDRANPLQSEYPFGASFTSFEAYKATQQRERAVMPRPNASGADTASETTLRTRYDALVADRVAAIGYRTTKTFVSSGILLALAVLLFLSHWRWVRHLTKPSRVAG